jgi:hypothetical protein
MLGGYLILLYCLFFNLKKKHFILGKLLVLVISKTFKEPTVFMKEPAAFIGDYYFDVFKKFETMAIYHMSEPVCFENHGYI